MFDLNGYSVGVEILSQNDPEVGDSIIPGDVDGDGLVILAVKNLLE